MGGPRYCPNCECDNCKKNRAMMSQDARIAELIEVLWKGPRPLPSDRVMLERFIGELQEEQAKNTLLRADIERLKADASAESVNDLIVKHTNAPTRARE